MTTTQPGEGPEDYFAQDFSLALGDNVYGTDGLECWWTDDTTPETTPQSNGASDDFFVVSSRTSTGSLSPPAPECRRTQTTPAMTSQQYKELKFMPQHVQSGGPQTREDGELQRKQRRREQNRRAQQNYKQKKELQLHHLSLELAEMKRKYGRAAEQCVSLSTELAVIRSTLARMVRGPGAEL